MVRPRTGVAVGLLQPHISVNFPWMQRCCNFRNLCATLHTGVLLGRLASFCLSFLIHLAYQKNRFPKSIQGTPISSHHIKVNLKLEMLLPYKISTGNQPVRSSSRFKQQRQSLHKQDENLSKVLPQQHGELALVPVKESWIKSCLKICYTLRTPWKNQNVECTPISQRDINGGH